MPESAVDIVVFAALAPVLGVLLFWFLQLLFIESNKYFLGKIQHKHEPLIRFTNFIGILFQSICHAMGFTVTKSGIAHFKVTVHEGKVQPKKEKKGIFEWIANGFLFFGPFFIPPTLLFITVIFLMGPYDTVAPNSYTFAEGIIVFGQNLFLFSQRFFSFFSSMDLFDPRHTGFMLLLIFLGLGMRPSYIGEKPRKKVDMIYDLKNIKNHIIQQPLYLFFFILFIYIGFYSSVLLQHSLYVLVFSAFGWLSLLALISILISHLIIGLIAITDHIPKPWRYLVFLYVPVSYVLFRILFIYVPIAEVDLPLSLFLMILTTLLVIVLLLKLKTNTFKSRSKMKSKRIEDGPKRIIKQ